MNTVQHARRRATKILVDVIRPGDSREAQQELIRRLYRLEPLVTSVRLVCQHKPCRGEPETHAISVGFPDSASALIQPHYRVVFYTDRALAILTEEQFQEAFEPAEKLSKKERWFLKGWNGALDAVHDVIGADISPAMRQAIAELRED